MKDLISGDSAKAQLELTEKQLLETEKKVVLKDSIIISLREKEANLGLIIKSEREKFRIVDEYSKKLEWSLKKEKVKSKFKSFLGVGIIAALTFLVINKIMALSNSDVREIERIARKEIRDFMETTTVKQLENRIFDMIQKEIKRGKLEGDIKEIALKMFREFYQFMWQNRSYWEPRLKNA